MENHITIEGKTIISEFAEENVNDQAELNKFFKNEENIPLSKLAKYYLNESLNFLCGSGSSVTIGGKTINKDENPFASIIAELKAIAEPKDHILQLIKFLESDILLEKKFDKINQEYLYYLNNREDKEASDLIKRYLDKSLKIFVEQYVPFPIDYVKDKLGIHELFINKIISRKDTLNRPKIFTPNYDLAFENACEKIGVSYNNGFRGVHMRKFDPDTFQNETYIKQDSSQKGKRISTYLNIYKLHGSISWQYAENINDLYNVKEVQISDSSKKKDIGFESLMIYPIQTKKSYSLDLPYSELFRNFSKSLTETQNTLVIIGYSFLDEHINDIIRTGLYNPNLTLVIHSYSLINDTSPEFLKTLKNRSSSDNRIILFEGKLVGDFTNFVKYLIPLNSFIQPKDTLIETLKELTK
jgi:hypothetical protein